MKKLLLFSAIIIASNFAKADVRIINEYSKSFEKAYFIHPEIPRGMLEAVAFCNTRFSHITHATSEPGSCTGIPNAYGVMGLTLEGKNYFFNNLQLVSDLSMVSVNDIISDPEKNILAYADAYAKVKKLLALKSNKVEDQHLINFGLVKECFH